MRALALCAVLLATPGAAAHALEGEVPVDLPELQSFEGFAAREFPSGLLLSPPSEVPCRSLTVFFPGHAQELGLRGRLPDGKTGSLGTVEKTWIKTVLTNPDYSLGEVIRVRGCPTLMLGDSEKTPTAAEIQAAMRASGATELKLLSHSGGYVGLGRALEAWRGTELLAKVTGLGLLDNFYDPALATTLRQSFASEHLAAICWGFFTKHNAQRFQKHFQPLCPRVVGGEDHKRDVRLYF